jgi:hypothetical protein
MAKKSKQQKPETKSGQLDEVGVSVVEEKDKEGYDFVVRAGRFSMKWNSEKMAKQIARELADHVRAVRDLAVRNALHLERESKATKVEPKPSKPVAKKPNTAKAKPPVVSAETPANSSHAA